MMPAGSTLEQTKEVVNRVQKHFADNEKEAVESCMMISGVGFSGRSQANGLLFVKLKDWHLRKRADLKVTAVAGELPWPFPKFVRASSLPSRHLQ